MRSGWGRWVSAFECEGFPRIGAVCNAEDWRIGVDCDRRRVDGMVVGLGDVEVLGVDGAVGLLRVHVRRRAPRPPCGTCGQSLWSDGGRRVVKGDQTRQTRSLRISRTFGTTESEHSSTQANPTGTSSQPSPHPKTRRAGLKSARERYERHLYAGGSVALERLVEMARTSRTALLCYEREHDQCHRSCILVAVQNAHPTIRVPRL